MSNKPLPALVLAEFAMHKRVPVTKGAKIKKINGIHAPAGKKNPPGHGCRRRKSQNRQDDLPSSPVGPDTGVVLK